MREWFSHLSMRAKLTLPISAVVLLMALPQLTFFPAQYTSGLEKGLEQKGIAIGSVVANAVGAALEFEDQNQARDLLKSATGDQDLVFITLLKEDGSIFSTHNPSGIEVPLPGSWGEKIRSEQEDGRVLVFTPVVSKTGVRGTLIAGFDLSSIRSRSLTNRITSTAIGVVLLFAGLVVAFGAGSYVQKRLDTMDSIAQQVAETALQVNATASQILAGSQQQERGSTEQSTAVDETRRTMESLLTSGKEITKASQDVLANAERTQKNNSLVGQRISDLTSHSQRIAEILEVIKDIANKSELLALNAALEGTKAGEAGRGFSLVATQMQRLAENVKRSVRDIKGLTTDIREATNATVLAMEEGSKVVSDTTRSARQISLIIQQQQSGTEQVSHAMDDVAQIAQQTAVASREAVDAIRSLTELAEKLEQLVDAFRSQGRA